MREKEKNRRIKLQFIYNRFNIINKFINLGFYTLYIYIRYI